MGTTRRNRSFRGRAAALAGHPKRAPLASETVKTQTDQLYEEARRDPRSEAGCIVRAFVLSGIRSAEAAPYEEGESALDMSRERQRQERASRRSGAVYRAEARRARAHAARLEKVLDEVMEAARSAQGNKMDPRAICNYIAEVVGLKAPSGMEPPAGLPQVGRLRNW